MASVTPLNLSPEQECRVNYLYGKFGVKEDNIRILRDMFAPTTDPWHTNNRLIDAMLSAEGSISKAVNYLLNKNIPAHSSTTRRAMSALLLPVQSFNKIVESLCSSTEVSPRSPDNVATPKYTTPKPIARSSCRLLSKQSSAMKEKVKESAITRPKRVMYGTGHLFNLTDSDSDVLHVTILKSRDLSAGDCPARSFIDNSNLRNAFSSSTVTEKHKDIIFGNKTDTDIDSANTSSSRKMFPLVAYSLDNKFSWHLGIMLNIHPTNVIVTPTKLNSDGIYHLSEETHSVNLLKAKVSTSNEGSLTTNMLHVKYLNRVSKHLDAGDGMIEYAVNDQDRFLFSQLDAKHKHIIELANESDQ